MQNQLNEIQRNEIEPLVVLADLLKSDPGAGGAVGFLADEIYSRLEKLAAKVGEMVKVNPICTVDHAGVPSGVLL